jgi:hypothetical protein
VPEPWTNGLDKAHRLLSVSGSCSHRRGIEEDESLRERQRFGAPSVPRPQTHAHGIDSGMKYGDHGYAPRSSDVLRPRLPWPHDHSSCQSTASGSVIGVNDDFDAMSGVIPSGGLDERQLVEFGTSSASDSDPQIV